MLQRIILRLVLYLSIEKIMETNVGVLPLDQWRIVKEIHFDYQFVRTWATARVVYLRSLSENYNMNSETGNDVAPITILPLFKQVQCCS